MKKTRHSSISHDRQACDEEAKKAESICKTETNSDDPVLIDDSNDENPNIETPPVKDSNKVGRGNDNQKDDHVSKDRLLEFVEDRIEQVQIRTDDDDETGRNQTDSPNMPEQVTDIENAKKFIFNSETVLLESCTNTIENSVIPSPLVSPLEKEELWNSTLDCSFSASETSINTLSTTVDEDEDEPHRPKKKLTVTWDPIPLLEHLYDIKQFSSEVITDEQTVECYFNVLPEGLFDNQNEKPYILIKGNHMFIYKTEKKQHLLQRLPLQYATVEIIDKNVLLLDNKLGKWIKLQCANNDETHKWKKVLQFHCRNQEAAKLEPVYHPLKCSKDVIIIDLGSCSTRAGILMDQPTLPKLFFPTVCATDKKTKLQHYGIDALLPNIRKSSRLSFPARPSAKITKFTMDIDALSGLFKMIFSKLQVDPKNYTVQLCIPRSLSTNTQIALVKLMLEDFGVQSVSLTRQALLTMYANNVSTAIVVDIGDRMEILPVADGFILEGGVSKLPYGGQRIFHHMKHALAQKHISLSNDVESFVVQYIFESLCYVAQHYEEELNEAMSQPELIRRSIPLNPFFQDDSKLQTVWLDTARFQVAEGLFRPDLWGLDSPGLHKLVHHAIQTSGMDVRRKMAENIYVSGGVTLLPGFVERLQEEVSKLTLPRLKPKVHASPHRYHMSYLGACQLALSDMFSQVCITSKEWMEKGPAILNRWHL